MSGRSTRSALSTSIRRRPRARILVQAGLDQRRLAGAARAGQQHVVGGVARATNCSVLRRILSFWARPPSAHRSRDRRHVPHRLQAAVARAALAVAPGDRRRSSRARSAAAAARPRCGRAGARHGGSGLPVMMRSCRQSIRHGTTSSAQPRQHQVEVFGGQTLETRACITLQPADAQRDQHRRQRLRVRGRRGRARRVGALPQAAGATATRHARRTGSCAHSAARARRPARRRPSRAPCRGSSRRTEAARRPSSAPARRRSASRSPIWLMSVNTLDSMNSISPSNICALLAKCRYSAASLTCSRAASAAVVMRSAPGCSSIVASVCRICTRRSPGLGRLRAGRAWAPSFASVNSGASSVSPGSCVVSDIASAQAQRVMAGTFLHRPAHPQRAGKH